MILHLIKIAIRNVLKNKRKTLAALLSISSGFVALNLFQAYIHDSEILFEKTYSQRNMFGDLLLRYQNRSEKLEKNELADIEVFLNQNQEVIDNVVRFHQFSGTANTGSKQANFNGFGYDIQNGERMRGQDWQQNTVAGSPLNDETSNQILVGRRLGESIGCAQTNPFIAMIGKRGYKKEIRPFACLSSDVQLSLTTDSGQANAMDVKIVGIVDAIFSEIDRQFIYAPLHLVNQLTQSDQLSFYALKIKDKGQIPNLIADFQNRFKIKYPELELKSWREYEVGEFYVKSMEFLHIFRNLITIVIVLIGTLSVKSTFFRLVFERRREIGTMLSIGFKRSHVYTLFIIESFSLSTLGVVIGSIFSLLLAAVINGLQIPYQLGMLSQPVAFSVTVDEQTVLFSSAVLISISVLSCCFPVFVALNVRIIEILRE